MTRRDPIHIEDAAVGDPISASAELSGSGPSAPRPTLPLASDDVIRSGKLAGMSMWPAIFVLAWPVLLESLLNSLVGATDAVLSAGLSESAADAVGGGAYFIWFIPVVATAVALGATALISRSMGRGRNAVAGAVVGQCVTISILLGIATAIFIAILAPWVARLLGLNAEAAHEAVTYIRLCALSVPQQILLGALAASCRGAGDSLRPLIVMVLVNVINIVLSFLLSGVDFAIASHDDAGEAIRRVLIENPLELNMGVAGIAWGTTIAWTIGAIVMTAMFSGRRGVHGVRLRSRRLRPHWHTIRRLVRVGLAGFTEMFGMWLGNFILILMVGWMRDSGLLGAHVIAVRIEAFSFMPGFAISLAAATLVGTYLGAGRPDLAKRAALRCTYIAAAMMGASGAAFVLAPHTLTGLFTQLPIHSEMVPRILSVSGYFQAIFAVAIVFRSVLRGAGDTASPAWITWICIWGLRMPLAWLLSGVDIPLPGGGFIPNPAPLASAGIHPLIGFWIGLCSELVIRAAAYTVVFLRGRWVNKTV